MTQEAGVNLQEVSALDFQGFDYQSSPETFREFSPSRPATGFSLAAERDLFETRIAVNHVLPNIGNIKREEKTNHGGNGEEVTALDLSASGKFMHEWTARYPEIRPITEEHPSSKNPEVRRALRDELNQAPAHVLGDLTDGTIESRKGYVGGVAVMATSFERMEGYDVPIPTRAIVSIPRLNGKTETVLNDAEGAMHYYVGGVEQELPHIRTLREIQESGELRVHVRGIFFSKWLAENVKMGQTTLPDELIDTCENISCDFIRRQEVAIRGLLSSKKTRGKE